MALEHLNDFRTNKSPNFDRPLIHSFLVLLWHSQWCSALASFVCDETQNAIRRRIVVNHVNDKNVAAFLTVKKKYSVIFPIVGVVVDAFLSPFRSSIDFFDRSKFRPSFLYISCSSQFTTMCFGAFFFSSLAPFSWSFVTLTRRTAYEWAVAQYTCSFPKINYAIYSYLLIPSSLSTFSLVRHCYVFAAMYSRDSHFLLILFLFFFAFFLDFL